MQVKKYEAPTIQEALETIKRELGPEAVILQTKKNTKSFGLMSKPSVEVTVAVSDRNIQKKGITEKKLSEPSKKLMQKLPAYQQSKVIDRVVDDHIQQIQKKNDSKDQVTLSRKKPMTATRYVDIDSHEIPKPTVVSPKIDLPEPKQMKVLVPAAPESIKSSSSVSHSELEELRKMIQELKQKNEQQSQSSYDLQNPVLSDLYEMLLLNGVDKKYALSLMKKVSFESDREMDQEEALDQLASEMISSISIQELKSTLKKNTTQTPHVITLVGSTGVGKTTTAAKLASMIHQDLSLRVALLNFDHQKMNAFSQLENYSKVLQVPFRNVSSATELSHAIYDLRNFDVILIDPAGKSQKDPASLQKMKEVFEGIGAKNHFYLVCSATTRDLELVDAAQKFSTFGLQGLIMTKLDEAMTYGGIYNLSQKCNLPLTLFTMGQNVPKDMEQATAERIVALCIDL